MKEGLDMGLVNYIPRIRNPSLSSGEMYHLDPKFQKHISKCSQKYPARQIGGAISNQKFNPVTNTRISYKEPDVVTKR